MLTAAYILLWVSLGAYLLQRRAKLAGVGATLAAGAALLLMTVELARRGANSGHWPLVNRYEFALWFVWSLLAVYLLLEMGEGRKMAGAASVLVALILLTFALTRPDEEQAIYPLTPALRSIWLQIHVLTAAVGYGAFGVAAGIGLQRLVRPDPSGELDPFTEEWLGRTMMRAVGLGFPWLTLSIISGGIWAQFAWGRYWGWDPKETWSLAVWVAYLTLFHLRATPGWRGRRLALAVVGVFLVLLVGFIWLPWLLRLVRLDTLHGF